MTSYYTANMNFQNDCVSPKTPPLSLSSSSSSSSSSSENSVLKKYYRSGFSSPYLNNPIINYYHNNVIRSGGSSGGSNRTPLSSIENLELSPLVKVQEDVLVMDGVLVNSKFSSKGGGGEKFSSSSSSGSGGSLYKTEMCKSWQDTGDCRYGCKCQFAHGPKEMRAINRLRNMKKLEIQTSKSKHSPLPNPQSPRDVFSLSNSSTTSPGTASSITSKLKKPSPPLSKDWSPMDDGISVSLPGETPTRVTVYDHINNVLYGPTINRRRLPVFRDICFK